MEWLINTHTHRHVNVYVCVCVNELWSWSTFASPRGIALDAQNQFPFRHWHTSARQSNVTAATVDLDLRFDPVPCTCPPQNMLFLPQIHCNTLCYKALHCDWNCSERSVNIDPQKGFPHNLTDFLVHLLLHKILKSQKHNT